MTWAQARIIVYLLGAATGAATLIWGLVHGDLHLVGLGAGFMGLGGLAGANTHDKAGTPPDTPRREAGGAHAAD